jgi:hypothetical protein
MLPHSTAAQAQSVTETPPVPAMGGLMPQTEVQDVAAYLVNELLRE